MGGLNRKRNKTFAAWRHLTVQLVLFVLMLQSLLPLGQALAFETAPGSTYQIICTGDGLRAVRLDANGAPVESTVEIPCVFCVLHAAPVALVPLDAPSFTGPLVERATYLAPTRQFQPSLWRTTLRPSRAPPRRT